ncbi:MAG: hypothetical protein WBZ36_01135 [Candidatus Nitrosopolaris sp.]
MNYLEALRKDQTIKMKIFLNIGVQIRRPRDLASMIEVDNKHFHATIEKMESDKIMKSVD